MLRKEDSEKQKTAPLTKVIVQKKRSEVKNAEQQLRKLSLLFVICYNCRGKVHIIKSGISASRTMSKKSKRKAVSVNNGKKKVTIIDKDGFTKVVNTQRTLSPTPGLASRTPIQERRIVKLVSDWDEVEIVKTKVLVEKVALDGWKVKGHLPGPSQW